MAKSLVSCFFDSRCRSVLFCEIHLPNKTNDKNVAVYSEIRYFWHTYISAYVERNLYILYSKALHRVHTSAAPRAVTDKQLTLH